MTDLKQTARMAVLETPFGADVLAVTRFDAVEGLSELFEFRIEAVSKQENLEFNKSLGAKCSLEIEASDKRKRVFNGMLVEAQWAGSRDDLSVYKLVLRPWFWLLAQTADCKIFHNKSPVEIIKEVFNSAGFTDFIDKLQDSYDKIPYCVQYRETKFAFVSRLMEEFGIYYYFEHSKSKHELVLADQKSSHAPVPKGNTVKIAHTDAVLGRNEDHFSSWTTERRFRTGKITVRDYDFEKPNADLTVDVKAAGGYNKSDLEVFDYPGRYTQTDRGRKLAKVKLDAKQALDKRRYAAGVAPLLFPGGLFSLTQHPTSAENKEYLVVRVIHSYTAQAYRSGGDQGGPTYRGSYEALESDIQYKAPPTTPRPVVHGPQTAKVVASKGNATEEIDVDKYGRILVCFHWDRDKVGSCRVRLGQVWSGKGWGGIFIPRVGQEVIVEFLEGDPDQPLVIGTVYNAVNTVPYSLPDNKTQAGIKSESTRNGAGAFNEFRFEDKKGEEKVSFRAEKDHEVLIRDSETQKIGENNSSGLARDVTLVKGDEKLTLKSGNQTVSITGKQSITVTDEIEIICGQSSIKMTPTSIEITSINIKLKAQGQIENDATLINSHANAAHIVKGTPVLIN